MLKELLFVLFMVTSSDSLLKLLRLHWVKNYHHLEAAPMSSTCDTSHFSHCRETIWVFPKIFYKKLLKDSFFSVFGSILELCTMAERKLLTSQVILSLEFLLNCWAFWLLLKFPLKLARAAGSQLAGKEALKQCKDQEQSRDEEQEGSIRILIWFKRQWMVWMLNTCVYLKRDRTSSEQKNPLRVN